MLDYGTGGPDEQQDDGDGGGAECVAERRCGPPHAGGEEQGAEAVGNVEKDEGEEQEDGGFGFGAEGGVATQEDDPYGDYKEVAKGDQPLEGHLAPVAPQGGAERGCGEEGTGGAAGQRKADLPVKAVPEGLELLHGGVVAEVAIGFRVGIGGSGVVFHVCSSWRLSSFNCLRIR